MHPLTSYCKRHDLRLYMLAKRLEVADSTLGRLVRLERRPSPALMAKIEAATDGEITVEELFRVHFLPLRHNVSEAEETSKTIVDRSPPDPCATTKRSAREAA